MIFLTILIVFVWLFLFALICAFGMEYFEDILDDRVPESLVVPIVIVSTIAGLTVVTWGAIKLIMLIWC